MSDIEIVDLLMVDDRTENLMALTATLESPDYNLVQATSGDEALRYLLDHDPAVILLDVQMPELDGFATASLIKKNERTRDIPIIFITACDKEIDYVHKGYTHGAVDYIHKPFDPHILRSKVSVFAELSRKTKRLLRTEQQLREQERREREQKISQLELRSLRREHADQKKYRELVDGLSHGFVWSANASTLQISFMSSSVREILGYDPDDCLREMDFFNKCLLPDDKEKFAELIEIVKKSRNHYSLEHRLMRSDGRELWFHTGLRIGLSLDGREHEIRGLSVDITKIKQAEAILRKNKKNSDFLAQASLVLSQSLDVAATLERVGALTVPNFADSFFIHSVNSTGALEVMTLAHSDGSALEVVEMFAAGELFDKIFAEGRALVCPDLGACTAPYSQLGRQLGLHSFIGVPLVARGKTIGVLTLFAGPHNHAFDEKDLHVGEDLARRCAFAIDNAFLYEEAQAAIHARDEFLSIASHELKTPITPLKLQLQSLSRMLKSKSIGEIQPARITSMLETSERQIGKLTKLIDDLLDISRIRIGKLKLNAEEFHLRDLLVDVIDRFGDQLSLSKCEVSLMIPKSIPVFWDRSRIEQVIINLLTNAMKYGQGKPIQIALWEEGEKIKIGFRDAGIGINENDIKRIFGRYERAVSGNHFGGLGLGLYIVQQIVSAHEGEITVTSTVGDGAHFVVALPPRLPLHLAETAYQTPTSLDH